MIVLDLIRKLFTADITLNSTEVCNLQITASQQSSALVKLYYATVVLGPKTISACFPTDYAIFQTDDYLSAST